MDDSDESDGDFFSNARVRELQNEDFALESTEGITLFAEGCSIVLFYNNNDTSVALAEIMDDLSAQFTDVNFFGVNMSQRRDIARRIGVIRNDANHMFNKFTLAKAPYIIAYRESNDSQISYPQAFYNGTYETQDIADWITESACQPGYTEYISDTLDEPTDVPNNTTIDEDDDGEVEVTRTPTKNSVDRILASRSKELDDLALTPDEYALITPKRDAKFRPNRHVTSTRGVGYVSFSK